jgi:hypothetical protein
VGVEGQATKVQAPFSVDWKEWGLAKTAVVVTLELIALIYS